LEGYVGAMVNDLRHAQPEYEDLGVTLWVDMAIGSLGRAFEATLDEVCRL